MNKIQRIKLHNAVKYSDERVNYSLLTADNYVGTDNLLQNKLGKINALYIPTSGFTTGYSERDILIGNIRPYLKKIWYAKNNGGSSADVLTFKVKDGYEPKFIYYSLLRDDFFTHAMKGSKGTKMPRGDKSQILDFLIPDLSLDIQQKITSVLSALDSKIELNNRINNELEVMVKTLYDYWFVQFDFPDEKGQPYKSCGGKMVHKEELGKEIPMGWEVFKISDLLKTSLGGTPSTSNNEFWENGTINWLNSGEIANFPIIESELKITELAINGSATELLPRGTTMLSITRHLRPSVLAIDACANQSVVGIKETSSIKYYFLYPYLVNEIPRLMSLRSGAQQPHINKETVDSSLILIPNDDSDILEEYYSKVGSSYELIMNNSMENKNLLELRDWLLPMLMNGQVKVN
jgi:type I restriction enzyme S subunit